MVFCTFADRDLSGMHKKIKISAVSYSNTIPFVYGLLHSDVITDIDLSLDVPSDCADKLIQGEVDVGLIPVAEIQNVQHARIISDYCIGATGAVRTVVLISEVPIVEIKHIYLDYQSRTSAKLLQVLAQRFWNIHPRWYSGEAGFEHSVVKEDTAALVIGDRTFAVEKKYRYTIDLSAEWMKFTGKPFVFASWVSNKQLSELFIHRFNHALGFGLNHLEKAIELTKTNQLVSNVDLLHYLQHSLSYDLNEEKKDGMDMFFEMARSIQFA